MAVGKAPGWSSAEHLRESCPKRRVTIVRERSRAGRDRSRIVQRRRERAEGDVSKDPQRPRGILLKRPFTADVERAEDQMGRRE
jgi:hypothetical protein